MPVDSAQVSAATRVRDTLINLGNAEQVVALVSMSVSDAVASGLAAGLSDTDIMGLVKLLPLGSMATGIIRTIVRDEQARAAREARAAAETDTSISG